MLFSEADKNNQGINISPVDQDNWRAVAELEVSSDQLAFVAAPSYYLALCCYGGTWHPLTISLGDQVIGFCMWGIDPTDDSCWLGGVLIDARFQGKGYGKQAVKRIIEILYQAYGHIDFALSYQPTNLSAKIVYQKIGFIETNEVTEGEIVARLIYTPHS
jgi:diamine N-acetyltransferase